MENQDETEERSSTFEYNMSLVEYLHQETRSYQHRTALIDPFSGRSLTFGDLFIESSRLGAALWHKCGVRQGDRVALVAPNCIDYPVTFFGLLSIGAVCVPINPMSTSYEFQQIAEDCDICGVITVPELIEKFIPVVRNTFSIRNLIIIGDAPPGYLTLKKLMEGYQTSWDTPPVDIKPRQTLAAICYSSGTTGLPKGCLHTHHNFIVNVRMMLESNVRLFDRGHDVTVTALSMSHMFGLTMFVTHGMAFGCTMVILRRFDLKEYLHLIQDYKATLLHVVSPILTKLINSPLTGQFNLTSVRCIQTGATALTTDLVSEFNKKVKKCDFVNAYGMTEVMHISREAPTRVSTSGQFSPVGAPLRGIKIKIVDIESRKILGPLQSGEIYVRTPSSCVGYWKRSEESRNLKDDDGYVRTGDVGFLDGAGVVTVNDRVKDLIKYNGYQVSPAELESIILRHPKVSDVAVVGVPILDAGERPKAFVVKKPNNEDITELEIVDFVNKFVSPYKRLHGGVVFVDEVPKTPSGKILRRSFRSQL